MTETISTSGGNGEHCTDDDDPALLNARTRKRFWISIGSIVVLFVGVMLYNLLVDVPLVISPETTYITSPLTADGTRVDYFAAVEALRYPPEMKTDDNGYRLIVRELGVDQSLSAVKQQQVYAKLGLTASPPTLEYTDPHTILRNYAMETIGSEDGTEFEALEAKLERPWTFDDLPMLEVWLKENSPALDLFAQGARKPAFSIPLIRENDQELLYANSLNDTQRLREIARGFYARAMHHVAMGKHDAAIDDIVSIRRLGRLQIAKGQYLIETLIGVALESISGAVGIASSLEHPPSETQLQRLLHEVSSLPPQVEFEELLEVERFATLDAFQALANGRLNEVMSDFGMGSRSNFHWLSMVGIDWNTVMRIANQEWEKMMRGTSSPPSVVVFHISYLLRGPRSAALADLLAWSMLPAYHAVRRATQRTECALNLKRISLAMLIYERQHGALPPAFTVDAEGNPLHSWRVLLLPILGEAELHAKIKLDEPWNSEHNQRFHNQLVKVYSCSSGDLADGETNYSVIIGDETPFSGGEGKRLDSFGPDSVDMILVTERITPVNWMDPTQEIPLVVAEQGINQHSSAIGLGSEHVGGAHFALRSGRVTFLSENMESDILRGLLTGTLKYAP